MIIVCLRVLVGLSGYAPFKDLPKTAEKVRLMQLDYKAKQSGMKTINQDRNEAHFIASFLKKNRKRK